MNRQKQFGARVDLSAWANLPLRALLFGEAQTRVVVSTPDPECVIAVARRHGVPARAIGTVQDGTTFEIVAGARSFTVSLDRLDDAYFESIPRLMSQAASAASDSHINSAV